MSTHKNYLNGDTFIQTVKERHPTYEILGDIPQARTDKTEVKCNKCNQTFLRSRRQLLENGVCPYCSGHHIAIGINDALTLHPWLKDYIPEEQLKGKASSDKEELPATCSNCGFTRMVSIKSLVKAIHKCPNCSDGISYPNKYGRSFLKQLPIENLITEYSPKWLPHYYKYDNYFEYDGKKYILEMDGGFHYQNFNLRGTLSERQERDKIKDELAKQHNIIVIRIKALESTGNYLRTQFLNSFFNEIFDLSNINWELCDYEASDNLVIQVCQYFNNGQYNTLRDIANHFNISLSTVNNYLSKGRKLGLCGYFTNTYIKRTNAKVSPSTKYKPINKNKKRKAITIQAYDENKNFIGQYNSIQECADELNRLFPSKNFAANKIAEVSKGDKQMRNTHKKFYFKRLEFQPQVERG